jgi:hypothetical protein
MERREFAGAVVAQSLSANINNTSSSFSVSDGSSFPSGSLNYFVISIGRGTPNEEKMLIQSRSSNSFTVLQRGYDGTTAVSHTAGELVDHVLDATVVQDMNTTVYDSEILQWLGV